jgi:lysozyme
MKASLALRADLKQREALRLAAYPDPGSRDGTPWTIGYGCTSYADGTKVQKGDIITAAGAEELFGYHVAVAEKVVIDHVKAYLSQNQFDALVSFAFNVGAKQFSTSTLVKKLNLGDYDGAAAQFDFWVYNDGQRMEGLATRRRNERELFKRQVSPAGGPPPTNMAQDKPEMAPALIPLLPFILDAAVTLIPALGKLFKGEKPSAVAERNMAAFEVVADKVIPILVATTGAPNLQGAVERIQADTSIAAKVDDAVRMNYAELNDILETSRDKARKFAVEYQCQPNVRMVLGKFTFIEILSLLLAFYGMLGGAYVIVMNEQFGSQIVGGVITLILIGGYIGVKEFWLGTSSESQRKTDMIAHRSEGGK